jgi:hypothetical protein
MNRASKIYPFAPHRAVADKMSVIIACCEFSFVASYRPILFCCYNVWIFLAVALDIFSGDIFSTM